MANKELQINEQITDAEVRVIGDQGEQLGIMKSQDALNLAFEKNLDLVKIAPKAEPPVCRVMDYGKYKFEQDKREKEAKKNQHFVELKEVRLGLKIDVGDFNTKTRQAEKFLTSGNKVKVSIRFRGRELGHPQIGYDVMKRFAEACSGFAVVERAAKLDGRSMLMFLAPKAEKDK